jgi:predicted enzyme related to lactoylglutathione lyase
MGRPIHFEILVEDPEADAEFYEKVFGWHVSRWDDPDPDAEQGYFLLGTGETDQPGIDGALMHPHFDQKVINTIAVEDIDATIKAVKAAGGDLLHGPSEVPDVGMHAYCVDPSGVLFGIMQPDLE